MGKEFWPAQIIRGDVEPGVINIPDQFQESKPWPWPPGDGEQEPSEFN